MAEKKKRGLFSWLGFGRDKQEEQEEINRAAELARLEAKEKIKTLLDETRTQEEQKKIEFTDEADVDLIEKDLIKNNPVAAQPQLDPNANAAKVSSSIHDAADKQEKITEIRSFSAYDLDEIEQGSIKEAAKAAEEEKIQASHLSRTQEADTKTDETDLNLTEKSPVKTAPIVAKGELTHFQEETKPEKTREEIEKEKAAHLARLMAEAEAHARKEAEALARKENAEKEQAELEKAEEAKRLAAEAKAQAEQEKAEEAKRLAAEAKAKAEQEKAEEAKRLAAEAKAQAEQEKAEEAKRLAAEAKAQAEKEKAEEAKRLAAEAKAKAEQEKAEEAKRLAAEAKAQAEQEKAEEAKRLAAEAKAQADLESVNIESLGDRPDLSKEKEQEGLDQKIIDKALNENITNHVNEVSAIEAKAKARAEDALRLAAVTRAKEEAIDALQVAIEAEKAAKALTEEAQIREARAKELALKAKVRAEEAQMREAEALRLVDEAKTHADEEEMLRLAAEAEAKDLAQKAQMREEEAKMREAEVLRLANIAKTKADNEEALRIAAEANAKALRERVQIREGEAELREAEALRLAEEAKAHAEEEEALRLAAEADAKALAEKAHNMEIQAREARLAAEEKIAANGEVNRQAFDANQHELTQVMPEIQGMENNTKEKEVDLMTAENKDDNTQNETEVQVKDKPKRDGFFTRLKQGLLRTKANFSSGFFGLLRGKKIDQDLFEQLEEQLLMADVGIETSNKIIARLTEKASRKQLKDGEALYGLLKEELATILSQVDKPLELKPKMPFVILMVGVNGVGKTTTIGKLAKQFQQEGKSVMLAAGDTFRAAAVEQLQAWGERNQVPVISQHTGADSASVIFDAIAAAKARNVDVIIADTAGRLQNKANLMEELSKIIRVMKKIDPEAPHEIMLTLDAGTGQNAISQARLFNEIAPLTGITITKLDGTAKGGVIFAIADLFNIPIRYIGVGEAIDDLRPFAADEFVDALFSQED